jgi:hypothetical protein
LSREIALRHKKAAKYPKAKNPEVEHMKKNAVRTPSSAHMNTNTDCLCFDDVFNEEAE